MLRECLETRIKASRPGRSQTMILRQDYLDQVQFFADRKASLETSQVLS
jgi:hypothetical protein